MKLSSVVNKINNKLLDNQMEGKWTIRSIIHHIADAQMNGYIRSKLIITEDKPRLKPFDQEDWANLADYQGAIQPTMSLIMGLYAKWFDFLYPFIQVNDAWDRIGLHPELGEQTLLQLVTHFVDHGYSHIQQIQAILEGQQ